MSFSNNYLAPSTTHRGRHIFGKSFFITPAMYYTGRASIVVEEDVQEVDGGFGGEIVVF